MCLLLYVVIGMWPLYSCYMHNVYKVQGHGLTGLRGALALLLIAWFVTTCEVWIPFVFALLHRKVYGGNIYRGSSVQVQRICS
jgi:hypothetical protein